MKGVSSAIRSQLATMDVIGAMTVVRTAKGVKVIDQVGAKPHIHHMRIPPPEAFKDELPDVEAKATLRTERAPEIFTQLSFNPAFWAAILPLNPRTTPYTLELMTTATAIASFVVQRCKALLNLPRPSQLSPRIQPLFAPPPYSTYPSGHATESRLLAYLLEQLLLDSSPTTPPSGDREVWICRSHEMLVSLAGRIAENRVVAGIHFPLDGVEGVALAEFLFHALSRTKGKKDDAFGWLWEHAAAEWK